MPTQSVTVPTYPIFGQGSKYLIHNGYSSIVKVGSFASHLTIVGNEIF